MRLSKRISITVFLSAVMFVICVSATAVKHKYFYGFDNFGWPDIFFSVKYNEGKIVQETFEINPLLTDFSIWLGVNATIMIIIRLLRVKRKPLEVKKEGLEKILISSMPSKQQPSNTLESAIQKSI